MDYNAADLAKMKFDDIWLGWTARESGRAGFRDVNDDHGNAQGKYQFDYRYSLVSFMKFCCEFNSKRYTGFHKYIKYGTGNKNLKNNSGLGKLWLEYCDKYPEEFEALQDTYAYLSYYLEIKENLKKECHIDLDKHHPVVRGSAFSMSIRSGSLTGAFKFIHCNDKMSDEEILRKSYGMYKDADAKRWKEENQLGDALRALKNNTYTTITCENGVLKTKLVNAEVVKTESSKPGTVYRVGTDWESGKCINQIGAYSVLDNAKKEATDANKNKKTNFYVFDPNGKKVYTADKYTVAKNIVYRVGTDWKSGKCINQIGAYSILDNAKKEADSISKKKKVAYFVFDSNGKKVYSGKL